MKHFIVSLTKNYFNFKGRATRMELFEFISVVLLTEVLLFVAAFVGFEKIAEVLSVVFEVFIIIPFLSLMVRRLHDCNFSGLWLFVPLLLLFAAYCILAYAMSEYPNLSDDDIREFMLGGKQDILSKGQQNAIQVLSGIAGVILVFVGVITMVLSGKKRFSRFGRPNK